MVGLLKRDLARTIEVEQRYAVDWDAMPDPAAIICDLARVHGLTGIPETSEGDRPFLLDTIGLFCWQVIDQFHLGNEIHIKAILQEYDPVDYYKIRLLKAAEPTNPYDPGTGNGEVSEEVFEEWEKIKKDWNGRQDVKIPGRGSLSLLKLDAPEETVERIKISQNLPEYEIFPSTEAEFSREKRKYIKDLMEKCDNIARESGYPGDFDSFFVERTGVVDLPASNFITGEEGSRYFDYYYMIDINDYAETLRYPEASFSLKRLLGKLGFMFQDGESLTAYFALEKEATILDVLRDYKEGIQESRSRSELDAVRNHYNTMFMYISIDPMHASYIKDTFEDKRIDLSIP